MSNFPGQFYGILFNVAGDNCYTIIIEFDGAILVEWLLRLLFLLNTLLNVLFVIHY